MTTLSTNDASENLPLEDHALVEALEDRIDQEDARTALQEARETGSIPLDALKEELGL